MRFPLLFSLPGKEEQQILKEKHALEQTPGLRMAQLKGKLSDRYTAEAVDNCKYMDMELQYAITCNIPDEDAILFMDPKYKQSVMREFLSCIAAGIPAKDLMEIRDKTNIGVPDINAVRKKYYFNLFRQEQTAKARKPQAGSESSESKEVKPEAGIMERQMDFYYQTIKLFTTQMKVLILDQQNANRAVLEYCDRYAAEESQKLNSIVEEERTENRKLLESLKEKEQQITELKKQVDSLQLNNQIYVNKAASDERRDPGRLFHWRKKKRVLRSKGARDELFSIICNGKMNEEQVSEIREAYREGIPIEIIKKIADPEIPASRMRTARMMYTDFPPETEDIHDSS